jgi:hypothetical protein
VPYPDEIAIEASGNSVTLRGTVSSFAQHRAAVADARLIPGVVDVVDELHVRVPDDDRRKDAEIRGAARQRSCSAQSLSGSDRSTACCSAQASLRGLPTWTAAREQEPPRVLRRFGGCPRDLRGLRREGCPGTRGVRHRRRALAPWNAETISGKPGFG